MTEHESIGFDMGCAIGFDMDSFDVDDMLAKYGLDRKTATLFECQAVLRTHVGEERWANGIRAIRSRISESSGPFN
jgi:hypothetical protein